MAKLCLTPVASAVTCLLLLISHNVRCQTILAPSKLYAGESNKLLLISDNDSTAQLKISHDQNSLAKQTSQTINFRKGQLVECDLVLDNCLANQNSLSLSVVFENGKNFVKQFELAPTSGLILLQSDKPIYRVTEQVKFRAIRIDRTLMPVSEKLLLLRIRNNQTLVVDEVRLETRPPTFIAEYSFNFPSIAKPGLWSAELLYGPNLTSSHMISLELTEYVLPLFRINIATPKFILGTKAKISTNVTYTYGKPVNGTLYYRFGLKENYKYTIFASSDTFCLKNGLNQFTYKLPEISLPKQRRLQLYVEAVVSDHVTGTKDRMINDHTFIVSSPYVISLKNTIRVYKPSITHHITFEVTNPNDEPVADIPLNLTLSSDKGDNIGPYIVSSSTDNLRTDKSGKVIFSFTLSKNIGNLNAFVETKDEKYAKIYQTNASFIIKPYDSDEDAFISISNKKEFSYSAGDRFHSSIVHRGSINLDQLYLVVTSKGVIIYSTKLSLPIINFELTNKMVPSIRILVISFTQSKRMISDSFRVYVRQADKCGVDVSLKSPRVIKPGANVTFVLKGNKNDVVGIHAVDEAVYILRNQKFLTRSKYKQVLTGIDLGCGPGGGTNSVDIIQNAGLKILSANLPDKLSRIDSRSCQTKLRPKRSVSSSLDSFRRQCCLLAYMKYSERKSCDKRVEILRKHTNDTSCIEEYLRCCKSNVQQNIVFVASSSGMVTNNDNDEKSQFTVYFNIEEELNTNNKLVRSDFRDTWLFDVVLLNDSIEQYIVPTPHSITSWFISTISITPKHGLCFNDAQQITTYKQFFIQISLPLAIVQHEHSEVVVTIFNYFDVRLSNIFVKFEGDTNICTESGLPGFAFRKNIPYINSHSSQTITFPFIPLSTGVFTINITAFAREYIETISNYKEHADKVVQKLTVLPPGTTEDKFLTFDLDPTNILKRKPRFSIDHILDETLPEIEYQRTRIRLKIRDLASEQNKNSDYLNIVPNSTRYVIMAHGERFSPQVLPIEDLDNLIKKPKGCGEQNMYYMAFNLYGMMYLEAIQKLNSSTRELGIKYLKRALRQQLSFRLNDGSFSAFDRRPSSVWLTGFVTKVVCQASPFLSNYLDANIIIGALKWLLAIQAKDGSFTETYPVLHENALGGVNGKMALTAYLHVALNECHQNLVNQIDLSNIDLKTTIEQSEKYLKNYINSLNDSFGALDSYSLALIAYALSFNQKLVEINAKLEENLKLRSKLDTINNLRYWNSEYPVETTSYALMAYLKRNETNVIDHISITNWLLSIQTNGTFGNTQNTVVALEALSRFYLLYKKENYNNVNLHINVLFDSQLKRSIEFHDDNSDIMQTIAVDPGTREIDFETSGNGLGKVSVLIIYNVYKPNGTCQFDLDVNINEFKIELNKTKDTVIIDEFDGSNFFKDSSVLMNDFHISKPKSNKDQLNCMETTFAKSKRSTRKFQIWNSLISQFSDSIQNKSSSTSSNAKNRNMRNVEDGTDSLDLPAFPNLGIDNPVVRLLSICARRLARDQSSDMTLLEVRMLSGYQPLKDDLEYIKNRNKNYVEAYENIGSKVSFYLRAIPHARQFCIRFRVYQQHNVRQIQSALVLIYSYYSKEWGCSRLYSDVRTSNYLDYKCDTNQNNHYCRCVTKRKCPNNEALEQILKLKNNFRLAVKIFQKLACVYSNVLHGTIFGERNLSDDHNTPVYQIREYNQIRGDYDSDLELTLNPECNHNQFPIDTMVVVMHSQQSDDPILLLDGSSILFSANTTDDKIMLKSLFVNFFRENTNARCRTLH